MASVDGGTIVIVYGLAFDMVTCNLSRGWVSVIISVRVNVRAIWPHLRTLSVDGENWAGIRRFTGVEAAQRQSHDRRLSLDRLIKGDDDLSVGRDVGGAVGGREARDHWWVGISGATREVIANTGGADVTGQIATCGFRLR